ncbi:MAG: NAD-dependent epimerase/dehydratase family protein [Novosphingobium sp.]|nr:NAD-dependent epimerase/dehydratase family protein [Novosphingobium sp.]
MPQGHILVTGASGLVGRAAMEHFARAGYKVTAVSRRAPFDSYGARHLSVDLADEAACRNAFSGLGDVTQIVFAALHEEPDLVSGWTSEAHVERNAAMLRNTVEAIVPNAPGLHNVTVLQGPKAYGAHVRLMKIGAREDRDEDRSIPNFYWAQEDYIKDRSHGQDWGWTILRPSFVMGMAVGGAMNLIGAIGFYAALLRHRGEPLHFPGSRGGVSQPTDTDLMARAIAWAGHAEAARDQVFNIGNGDLFSLAEMWPVIADALGMEVGDDRGFLFEEEVPKGADEWGAIRRQHALISPDATSYLGQSAQFADWIFARASAGLRGSISTVKLQNAGFTEAMYSEDMFRKWIARYQQARLIPPRG